MATIAINATGIPEQPTGAARWQYSLIQAMRGIETLPDWRFLLFLPKNIPHERVLTGTNSAFYPVSVPTNSTSTFDRLISGPVYTYLRSVQRRANVILSFQHPIFPSPLKSIMVIYDIRFMLQPETYRTSRRFFLKTVVPFSLKYATHIVTISDSTKHDLVQLLEIDPAKISVIYPGVNEIFRRLDQDSDIISSTWRYLTGHGIRDRYILYVGHIEPRKNIDRLIQALPLLYDRLSERIPLVIVGAQYYYTRDNLVQRVAALGLHNDVIFADRVDDDLLVGLYNLASVHALPSTHEGFGMTLLEAMACGAPILTSTAGSLPEVAGDAALLSDPYDIPALADGLYRVLASSSLSQQLRARGFDRVRSFSWQQSACDMLHVMQDILHH